jgi:glycosyltransferase involved in cell wall biosynthesis
MADAMSDRHVLMVAHNFPPAASVGTLRPLRFARYLAAAGWRVTVLTVRPDTYASVPLDPTTLDRIPGGISLLRAPVWRSPLAVKGPATANSPTAPAEAAEASEPGTARRGRRALPSGVRGRLSDVAATLQVPDKEQGWIPAAYLAARRTAREAGVPDVIYSTSPPWSSQIVALLLQRAFGCPWVADFRDPWARAPWREDRPRHVQRILQALEHRVVRAASRVVFVSETNLDEYSTYYGEVIASKFALIPNGCETDEFDALSPAPQSGFTLLHAGSLYGGRDPLSLIHALAGARDAGIIDEGFRFVQLGGFGRYAAAIEKAAATLALRDHIVLRARAPRLECLQEMVSASALLLLQPGTTVAIPGKVYEYFAAGRPILAITPEGDTARLVRDSGIGVVADPDRPSEILAGLARVIDMASTSVTGAPRALYDAALQSERLSSLLSATLAAPCASAAESRRAQLGGPRS